MLAALGTGQAGANDAAVTRPLVAGDCGLQERHGDEIIACGRAYRIGTRVVLWTDEGGYDAYRTGRRFVPFERSDWKSTLAEMRAGTLTFAAPENQETSPDRYDLRFGSAVDTAFTPEQLEQVRGGGWPLPLLQEKVDQFVLHYDVCGTSAQCFYILHDVRGLSVHFLLDVDGTIYQTLDLKERARHATKSNDRSIGVEIANVGAYPVGTDNPFGKWYAADGSGARLIFPPWVRGRERFAGKMLRSRHGVPITGTIRGTEYVQYDYTPEQYSALTKLAAALCDIFPRLRAEIPRGADGQVLTRTLGAEEWARFAGILGHYHVQQNKGDPGPALDWDHLLTGVKKHLQEIRRP
ncbi:MAG: N-acetylmuramoyl-L-alanine amidase [Planctomycetes bacterium]|nr:N-acetylmuramoyl-L-alanine amidase [Planctomycetota bacterium]